MFGNREVRAALHNRRTDVRYHAVTAHLRQASALNELLYIVASDRDGFQDLDFETLRETIGNIRTELTAALASANTLQPRS